ncbi:TetR/AcrR family transcriptional regulator [Saccharothrix longispora]|uniref:TetR/AcrR family transcriptional regulator n=1 Tax=Saccharothrix longispora TaxID=33920 RepID=UPI0028FD0090|nr:TetR/AcrR family transcriptional regulator [Saccharothrix longispora]MBY8851920.1 TetR/AcrR family transcriptional regulator [Saccharothrix sp. MB29]MDU0290767.1 TetR/AcrR family transcriptional regulator [Saccharothrix longispora]
MATRGRPRSFDRDQALRTAMLAFWDRGFESVSTTELASGMNISQSSLYAAFGDKQSLFREAIAYYGEHEGSIARRALAGADTARQAVESMLRQCADRFTDGALPSGCMVVLAATNTTADNAAVQEFASQLRKRDEAALRERIDRAKADGELSPRADAAALATYYHSVLYGLSIQARDGRSREELHTVIDLAMAVWPT